MGIIRCLFRNSLQRLLFWYYYILIYICIFHHHQRRNHHCRLRHHHYHIILTMFIIIIVIFLQQHHCFRSMHRWCLRPGRNKDDAVWINGMIRNLLPGATEYRAANKSRVLYNMKKSHMKCHSACKVILSDSQYCLQRSSTEHFDTQQAHH